MTAGVAKIGSLVDNNFIIPVIVSLIWGSIHGGKLVPCAYIPAVTYLLFICLEDSSLKPNLDGSRLTCCLNRP